MPRKAFSLLLSLFIFSGCATKLPPRVDYIIGEKAKPDIEQPDDKLLTQVLFETKIDEIKVKTQQFIVSDSIKTIFFTQADSLLAGQQRYFLKNENKPNKYLRYFGHSVSTFWVMLWLVRYSSLSEHTEDPSLAAIIATPIIWLHAAWIGGVVGSLAKGKKIKPEYKDSLQKLIADYNKAAGIREN